MFLGCEDGLRTSKECTKRMFERRSDSDSDSESQDDAHENADDRSKETMESDADPDSLSPAAHRYKLVGERGGGCTHAAASQVSLWGIFSVLLYGFGMAWRRRYGQDSGPSQRP